MPLKVYNTLSQKKEVFRPKKAKRVNLFVCGPTVYDFAHIGHARTYIVFDIIVGYLKYRGYKVYYLQNITDVDDKIIFRAKEKKVTAQKLARVFEKEYLNDMKKLKINSVTKYARATDHIKEIIGQVKRLLKKGYAYQIKNGIYYDISKFKNYGKLSRRTVLQAEDAVSRIDEGKEKRNKGDFCLWKYGKEGELSWPSPWGPGQPGWHIEDTAITEKFFGPQYDIHGGARDLIFPHHEAEIAQMEAISGKSPLVKYWLHSGFLTVKGRKMAKSLGNFITVRDFLKKYSPRILRLIVLKNHYRSPLDYNERVILQTKKELEKIDEFIEKCKIRCVKKTHDREIFRHSSITKINGKFGKTFEKIFEKTMDDDFNTPKSIAALFKMMNRGNSLMAQNKFGSDDAKKILDFLKKTDRIFNFIFWQKPKTKIPREIIQLVKKRENYRQRGTWQKADEIRKKIQKLGYRIEDTKKGAKIRKLT